MTTSLALNRSRERILRLCEAALEDHELRQRVLAELGTVVPFNAFAWPLSDPETATGLSPMARIPCPDELPLLIRLKYLTSVGRWTALMGRRTPALSLLQGTCGSPSRSLLWDGLLRRYGVTDVLSTVFADRYGCWGWLDLWRGAAEGAFSDAETDFLAGVAPGLAGGLRRSRAAQCRRDAEVAAPRKADRTVTTAIAPPTGADRRLLPPQAVLILDADLSVAGQSASADEWLELLQRGPKPYEGVPAEVLNVAAQLLATEAGVDPHPAASRVPVGSGAWALLRATRLASGRHGAAPPLAVTIQECPASDRMEVFARCFGLTRAQRQLLDLAAGGLDTAALAAALRISPLTVQDQFKTVFAACGVRSRGALLALALGAPVRSTLAG